MKINDVDTEVDTLNFIWNLENKKPQNMVIPVYLYANRSKFLFGLDFNPVGFDNAQLYQRGIAFIANSSL
jgi:hypothetical protein